MNTKCVLLMLVLGVAVARGEEEGPEGTWHVVEPEDRVETRTVVRDAQGQLSLRVGWPGTNTIVTLIGAARGEGLDLRAELGEKGMIRELLGQVAPDKVRLSLRATPLSPAEKGGPARLRVDYSQDGASWGREVWTRTPKPTLEVVALQPQGAWDPKAGPLRVRYRVRGAAQDVRLRVMLPGGTSSKTPRGEFYAKQLGGGPRPYVHLCAQDLGRREIGTHEAVVEGRDATPAARILLAGEWTLRLESTSKGAAEQSFQVAPPKVELVATRWVAREFTDPTTGELAPDPGRNHAELARIVSSSLLALGSTPRAQVEGGDPAELVRALAESAMVIMAGHGGPSSIDVYLSTVEERQAAPAPMEDPARIVTICASALSKLAAARGGARPLQDLHTVAIWACSVGANGAEKGSSASVGDGSGLPSWLIGAGADIVIAFDSIVFSNQINTWLPDLLARLSSRSEEKPANGVRSLAWAAREAAHYSDKLYWGEFSHEKWRRTLAAGVRPLGMCIQIFTAGGIDASTETFDPPRYGNSRN